jgi:type II secretion system protein D
MVAGAGPARRVGLRHAKVEQIEAALWTTLGSRLLALPAQRPPARRYRLALSGGGAVELTLDPEAGQVVIDGPPATADTCVRLIRVLDSQQDPGGRNVRLVPLAGPPSASIQRAAAVIRNASGGREAGLPMVSLLFQPRDQGPPGAAPPAAAAPTAPAGPAPKPAGPPGAEPAGQPPSRAALVNPVQIEMLEGLDVLVLRGNAQDVDQVLDIISQVERLSAQTEPAIEILPLAHVDCQAMGSMVRSLYAEVYLARQGSVSITPVVKPNALLIVGRPENVETVKRLVGQLDQPVPPGKQFKVFPLRLASASSVQATIQEFFADRGGLGTVVHATADTRSNALIVQASPRDMAEVAALVRRLDTATSAAVNEVRIIQLEHAMAQDVATILQSAIGAAAGGGRAGVPGMGMPVAGVPPAGQPGQGGRTQSDQRTAMLRFLTIDAKGRKLLNSGILSDVRITADVHANSLIVAAPPENLELLEALIHQLDRLPAAEAQLKVFTIVNGDATGLSDMLQKLFATQAAGQGQAAGGFPGMGQAQGTSTTGSIVPLRFAVDTRTNSIIVSGIMNDLAVVEAILTRLDDSDIRHRKTVVFRLKNAPATQVANTITEFLRSERQVQQLAPGLTSPFEQLEREVVVEPEAVSNSLVLSATPRFFEEIKGIIEQLDARPPMVMIQVLIAEVDLGNTNEFGMELGLQDSVLFDRSLLSNLQTITQTITPPGQNQITNQTIVAANNTPGFNFNNNALGNSGSSGALSSAANVGSQGLSNFGLGQTNSQLGYGGLVLSASSENVSFLLRALAENHRVEVLQRPQVMTLDNQPAFIQVGQRVPTISGTTNTANGLTNSMTFQNVGVMLGVTPRISPDGLVVMEIDAEKSALEPVDTGIPITSINGQLIRSPITDTTTAQTTVSALSDQTVVLGGLIVKSKTESHRKVPWLGDLPILGHLFRYDSASSSRTELLIIMTPHIVKNEADADAIRRAEVAKISWTLCDVINMYGEAAGLRTRSEAWPNAETSVVYPDRNEKPPADKSGAPETIPAPGGKPIPPPAPNGPTADPALPPAPKPDPQARYPGSPSTYPPGYPAVQPVVYQQPLPTYPPGYPAVQPVVYQQPLPTYPPAYPPAQPVVCKEFLPAEPPPQQLPYR